MEAKWFTSDSYRCDECNMIKDTARLVEERIDPETGNPVGLIELKCGHTQKVIRVSNEVNIAPLFRNIKKVTVEPQFTSGAPSVAVSGGGLSIVGYTVPIKLDLSHIQTNNLVMNVSNVNIHGNNAVVRQGTNFSEIHANLGTIQQTIQKDIPDENEKQEVMSLLEDIKTDLKSQRIPYSNLNKLKKFEKIYNLVLHWAMKAIEYVAQNGTIPL
jgi:hypothetical protein